VRYQGPPLICQPGRPRAYSSQAKAPAPPSASRLHAKVGRASACQRPLAGAFLCSLGENSMPENISIRIDGEYVPAHVGQTILEVARAGGKYIPTLCWLAGISSVGACRLCIVEVSGVGRLLPACTTPVQDGMSVTTNSEKLTQYRKIAIEFLLRSLNRNSMAIFRYCVSFSELVVTLMPSCTGVVQAGNRRPTPETSTMQRRQAPTDEMPSSQQRVGMYLPPARATSRMVCPS